MRLAAFCSRVTEGLTFRGALCETTVEQQSVLYRPCDMSHSEWKTANVQGRSATYAIAAQSSRVAEALSHVRATIRYLYCTILWRR